MSCVDIFSQNAANATKLLDGLKNSKRKRVLTVGVDPPGKNAGECFHASSSVQYSVHDVLHWMVFRALRLFLGACLPSAYACSLDHYSGTD